MQTITIEGDLHVSGDFAAFDPEGLPITIKCTGTMCAFTSSKPERGVFIDGPLFIQGDITVACQGAIEPASLGRD
jgi:hypothetical protein